MEMLKSFFRFTSRERLAILLLCLLMVLFWSLPWLFPEKASKLDLPKLGQMANPIDKPLDLPRVFEPNYSSAKNLPALVSAERKKTAHYFFFNPNTITAEAWQELGLRPKTIQTILHYLQKGGRFRQASDIRKIWGLSPQEADQLIPYIQIPSTIAVGKGWKAHEPSRALGKPLMNANTGHGSSLTHPDTLSNAGGTSSTSFSNKAKAPYPFKNWQLLPIEINQADTLAWMAFPGIGQVLAARIIKYRDKMGGFKSIEQVGKTYGIKDSLFQLMKPFLRLSQGAEKKD